MDPNTGQNERYGGVIPEGLPADQREALPVSYLPADWERTSRNAPCPCGSGKKFKHCHGALV
jgi:preprotein translocase subunit SecA